jgi:hypothetical protein
MLAFLTLLVSGVCSHKGVVQQPCSSVLTAAYHGSYYCGFFLA